MRIKYIIPMLMDSVNPFYIFSQTEDIYTRTLLKINFSEFDIMFTDDKTVTESYNTFIQYFTLWKQANNNRIQRILEALNSEYNPIENMSLTEVNKSVIAQSDTSTKSKNLDYTMTNKAVTYDNGLKDDSKQQMSYDGEPESTTSYEQDKSLTIGDSTYTGNMTSINSIERHGNVGIQSNVGYIMEEISLRRKNFIYELLKDFVNEYCIYVGGDE